VVKRNRVLLGALLVMGASLPAVAQEGWSGDVEAGLVTTSGNTDETSISGAADVTRDWMDWRQNVLLESRYTEQNDERSAERYTASTQLDYKFTPNDFVFIRAGYDNDDFSGYQFQASTTAGYGRRIWEDGEVISIPRWAVVTGTASLNNLIRNRDHSGRNPLHDWRRTSCMSFRRRPSSRRSLKLRSALMRGFCIALGNLASGQHQQYGRHAVFLHGRT